MIFFSIVNCVRFASKGQAAHAMAMAGRRAMAQSMFHELGPKGIHVAHVLIDAMIVSPDTGGKFWDKFMNNDPKRYCDFETTTVLDPHRKS